MCLCTSGILLIYVIFKGEALYNSSLQLANNRRYDSPGFSAKHCSCSGQTKLNKY